MPAGRPCIDLRKAASDAAASGQSESESESELELEAKAKKPERTTRSEPRQPVGLVVVIVGSLVR